MSVTDQSEQKQEPSYKQFRLTVSNPVLVQAIEELQRQTGMSEREIAEEGIIHYLEEENQILLSE